MWSKLARFILVYRLPLLIVILLLTAFMGYMSRGVERAYDYAAVVPDKDPDMQYFKFFKQKYGEDGNILAIGVHDSSIYRLDNFRAWAALARKLETIDGVERAISIAHLQYLHKDTAAGVFRFRPIFDPMPNTQQALDSLLSFTRQLRFYSGQVFNQATGATVLLVSIDKQVLNTAYRETVIRRIEEACEAFQKQTNIEIHYAGLPYVRSTMATKVTDELNLFLILSVLTTATVLFLFFRSFKAVLFPLIIIGIIVTWTLGWMGILHYQITLLTGLLPPILVVIGIPNAVYMLTKYHQEFKKHGNKILALVRVIQKIGVVTLITNTTTAVGFGVLMSTNIAILREFGVVASINIFCTFLLSIILIPVFFSYLPEPKSRHLRHLDGRMLNGLINTFVHWVTHKRPYIYAVVLVLLGLSIYGTYKIRAISYMVDDIPEHSRLRRDLAFFEKHFKGVMPLEIVVNTGKPKGTRSYSKLKKINEFQNALDSIGISPPALSMITFLKAARQAFYNQDSAYYDFPSNRELPFLMRYLKGEEDKSALTRSFLDSTEQEVRISMKIADIGSVSMDSLIHQVIEPKIKRYLPEKEGFEVHITGTTPIFIKGNSYLIRNLKQSILLAFVLIAFIMGLLFRSVRMVLVSVVPNFIPLLITAGIMGWFGIPLKPSTALIFSIAFGIAVDDAIHYLARFRSELFSRRVSVREAVVVSLRETGQGMVYTSIILFFGFVIFVGSNFGGTVALGLLTSLTLFTAMFTNLILLPSLLLSFDRYDRRRLAWTESYDESKEPKTSAITSKKEM